MISEEVRFCVYYEDVDCGGVVYHANYLKFMERARAELLKNLGLSQLMMVDKFKIGLIVSDVVIKYLKPAKFEDELRVVSTISDMTMLKLTWKQEVYRNYELEPITDATITTVCVNHNLNPIRIPSQIFDKLSIEPVN